MRILDRLTIVGVAVVVSGCANLGVYDWTMERYEMHLAKEAQRQAMKDASQEPQPTPTTDTFVEWLRENEEVINELCTTPPGPAHVYAFDHTHFAVSKDTERAEQARAKGYRVIQCPEASRNVIEANQVAPMPGDAQTVEPPPGKPPMKYEPLPPALERAMRILIDAASIAFLWVVIGK